MIFRKILTKNSILVRQARSLFYVQGQSPEPNVREYFYFIDHQGMLFLDDAKMKNFTSCYKEVNFLKFFFKRLKKNDTLNYTKDFPFLSLCGKERNYVRCDDLPIVFTQIIDDENLLSYNHGARFLTVDFQPEKICMEPETGRIYHPGPERTGGLGLLSDKLGITWTAEKRFVFGNGEDAAPTAFKWKGDTLKLSNDLIGKLPPHPKADSVIVGAKEKNPKEENEVLHDFASKEFLMMLEDGSKAYVQYQFVDNTMMHFQTTQVPSHQQGRGLGRILVKYALDFCVQNNLNFKSSCWYINDYLSKNPSKMYRKLYREV